MIEQVIQGDFLQVSVPKVDMIITSPPYDDLRVYNGYAFDFKKSAEKMVEALKEGGVLVWVVADRTLKGSETSTSFKQALYFKELGLNLHDTMIWRKPNPMPQVNKSRYTQQFEYMFVFSKGKPKTTNILEVPTKYGGKLLKTHTTNPESIRRQNKTKITKDTKLDGNVWDIVVAGTNYGHPAIFPLELAERHILSWSNPGDLVLDPLAGSGTTGVACKKLGRQFILIETSLEYIEIINKRLTIE